MGCGDKSFQPRQRQAPRTTSRLCRASGTKPAWTMFYSANVRIRTSPAWLNTSISHMGDPLSFPHRCRRCIFVRGAKQYAVRNPRNRKCNRRDCTRHYPSIRLFTVGQKTSSATPLGDLQTIEQPWSVASHQSIAGGGGFGLFSAVCWIFGREVLDRLGGTVPIGLVSNNWGCKSWQNPSV